MSKAPKNRSSLISSLRNQIKRPNRLTSLGFEHLESRNLCAGMNELPMMSSALIGEGVGEKVEIQYELRDLQNQPIVDNIVPLGSEFELVVMARDLRTQPNGIFALYENLSISLPDRLQLVYGETQRIEINADNTATSFTLTIAGTTTQPISMSGDRAANIATALNTAFNVDGIRVRKINPNNAVFDVIFEGALALQDIPPMSINIGSTGGSVTDNVYLADPINVGVNNNATRPSLDFTNAPTLEFGANPQIMLGVGSLASGLTGNTTGQFQELHRFRFQTLLAGSVSIQGSPGTTVDDGVFLFGEANEVSPELVLFDSISINVFDGSMTAVDDIYTGIEDASLSDLSLLDNDVYSSTATVEIISVSSGSAGGLVTISSSGIAVNYVPAVDFFGTETFTYTISDGTSQSTAMVTVNVEPVNDVPRGSSTTVQTNEDTSLSMTFAQLLQGATPGPANESNQLLTIAGVGSTSQVGGLVQLDGSNVSYTPPANFFGTDTFTVTIMDDGTPSLSAVQTVTVVVAPINDPPVLSMNDLVILSEDGILTVPVNVILAGGGENQQLALTAVSDNKNIVLDPTVSYLQGETSGSLTFRGAINAFGEALVMVRLEDGGLDNDLSTKADNASTAISVVVQVTPVNDPPLISPVSNVTILEDSGVKTINLAGILAGPNEQGSLIVSARSSNPEMLAIEGVSYTSPSTTGVLSILPAANAFGEVTVFVDVTDEGNLVSTVQFQVTISPENDNPTFGTIAPVTIEEDAPEASVTVSGISAGPSETQPLRISAVSSNRTVIDAVIADYVSPEATGVLRFAPKANVSGVSVISVTLEDAGLDSDFATTADNRRVTQSFTVEVTPKNDPPVLDNILDQVVAEDSIAKIISLRGIGAGAGETQELRVTATSSNRSLIDNPTISYVSPGTTGTLTFIPIANMSGQAVITVSIEDGGLDRLLSTASDNGTTLKSFTVTVTPVNDLPLINDIGNVTVAEDSLSSSVPLAGILAGGGETQPIRVTATSSRPLLVPTPTVTFVGGPTGSLQFAPLANAFGSAIITVLVEDGGLDLDLSTAADNGKTSKSFTINVTGVNDAPNFDSVPNRTVSEDAPTTVITLSGITAGPGETQPLRILATSGTTTIVPNPTITYVAGAATGSLSFAPIANSFGTAVITVVLEDGGLDGSLTTSTDNGRTSKSFTITVTPVNDLPTINTVANKTVLEDSLTSIMPLTGISSGSGEAQPLKITATSSAPLIVPNPTVNYTSGANGTLSFAPVANAFGTAIITLVVEDGGVDGNLATATDNGRVTKLFTITVNPVNDAPTIDTVANKTVAEDALRTVVSLTGISSGIGERQPVRITATSNAPLIVPNPTVVYSTGATGTLSFTPFANANGNAIITLLVEDGGLDGNLATAADNASVRKSFTISVTPVNDIPTLNLISNVVVSEDAPRQTVLLTGISSGAGERQAIRMFATSSNVGLIPNPAVAPTTTGGSLTFTPVANGFGSAIIVVTVEDAGLDGLLTTAADNLSIRRTFTITVNPVNDAPTMGTISNVTLIEDAPEKIVTITGISAGGGESQTLRLIGVSNNATLIPNPTFVYTAGSSTATMKFKPLPGKSGTAVIVVTVEDPGLDRNFNTAADNGRISKTFTVNVTAVNDVPTINPIADRTVVKTAGIQTVSMTGISAGLNETQSVRIKVTSSNPLLIPTPTVSYVSPSSTGTLRFTPNRNLTGRATITVTVEDAGLDGNLATLGDNARKIETFVITVR